MVNIASTIRKLYHSCCNKNPYLGTLADGLAKRREELNDS